MTVAVDLRVGQCWARQDCVRDPYRRIQRIIEGMSRRGFWRTYIAYDAGNGMRSCQEATFKRWITRAQATLTPQMPGVDIDRIHGARAT